ncbi:mitochondrial ATPase expression-domain-containing protein [Xylaria cf. heliscus]|nr:mitochondrial ATPase expression-domain-containing protein [Xylaria cf. heliscus]
MLSGVSMAESRGCRVLLRQAPRGTPSSILTLRLRRCFHRPKACRLRESYALPLDASHNIDLSPRDVRTIHSTPGFRHATPHSSPSLISQGATALVQSLLPLSHTDIARGAEPRDRHRISSTPFGDGSVPAPASAHHDTPGSPPIDPFLGALHAMRHGDTRELLSRLEVIERMSREDLQDAAATIPRTTFTEFFRALDPLRVARDCDPVDESHTPVGMFKMLNMESSIDDWGIRKLYTRVLRRLLILMNALEIAGYALHPEEYISLFRCAGASSDISGAGAIWNHLVSGPVRIWQNSDMYTEYIKARFLTEPLYTNYQKITRMVTPRNLHRSRLTLSGRKIRRLDHLHMRLRLRRLRIGLNKEQQHVEDLMRALRGNRPALALFRTVIWTHSFRLDENIMCTLMIALGRSGSLRFIGIEILQKYFGIRTPHPFPPEAEGEWARTLNHHSEPPRIMPTVRLMRAIVETYGSNAEIGLAIQLVEHLSNKYSIPIPYDVWQDLLEWTYIMSTPPASTAWETAKLYFKIPSPQAVEMIWTAMVSPPYNLVSTFQNYDLLIRSLIGRRGDDLTPALSHMRRAIALYDEQCREYEAAVFEYTQHLRDDITSSAVLLRFERARFKKQRMWYSISLWCRMLLKRIPFSEDSPVPSLLVPAFIREFRPFLKNPIEYETPTGHVSLVDPAIEMFRSIKTDVVMQDVRMKNMGGKWTNRLLRSSKVAVLSSHSLAEFKPPTLRDPLTLLAPSKHAFVVANMQPDDATSPPL